MHKNQRAFTLVELLVVISIIALLISILLPSLRQAREQAKLVKCGANLHQISLAQEVYANNYGDWYPAWSCWHVWGYYGTEKDGENGDDEGPAWTEQLRDDGSLRSIDIYQCPSFPREVIVAYFQGAYAACQRYGERATRRDRIRYPLQFVLSGDCTNPFFYAPPFGTNEPLDIDDADMDNATQRSLDWSRPAHAGKTNNVLFADGHVLPYTEFRANEMTHDTLQRGIDWGELDLK